MERLFDVVYWWQTVQVEILSDVIRSLQVASVYYAIAVWKEVRILGREQGSCHPAITAGVALYSIHQRLKSSCLSRYAIKRISLKRISIGLYSTQPNTRTRLIDMAMSDSR